MLLDQLRKNKAQLDAAGKQYGTRRIRVFGSVARREEHPGSDIGVRVDLPHGYDLFAQRMPLQQRRTEITRQRPDVVLVPEHELTATSATRH